jgi:hypothetical protein
LGQKCSRLTAQYVLESKPKQDQAVGDVMLPALKAAQDATFDFMDRKRAG